MSPIELFISCVLINTPLFIISGILFCQGKIKEKNKIPSIRVDGDNTLTMAKIVLLIPFVLIGFSALTIFGTVLFSGTLMAFIL